MAESQSPERSEGTCAPFILSIRMDATEVRDMTTEVTAEPYQEDPNWDGTVEDMSADAQPESDEVVNVPKRRGRRPLTLPNAAARFERAKAAVARLSALDVAAEREKLDAQAERLDERRAKLDGHDTQVKEAAEELEAAEEAFNAALADVQSK